MSRRDQIQMTTEEVWSLLEEQRVVVLASNGRDGWPHLMPLWYVVRRDGRVPAQPQGDRRSPFSDGLRAWTFAKSQKVKNLERDPRCTLQVETGELYHELRGVMFKANVVIHRDLETVTEVGAEVAARYGGVEINDEMRGAVAAQARKRVAFSFDVTDVATWDHRKLGGVY